MKSIIGSWHNMPREEKDFDDIGSQALGRL